MARAWFRPARARFSGLGRVCVLLAGEGGALGSWEPRGTMATVGFLPLALPCLAKVT